MAFERRAVTSSNIAEVGYDADEGILEVSFNNGRVYEYYRVPESAYLLLVSAPSVGGYFNDFVKDTFACRRVK